MDFEVGMMDDSWAQDIHWKTLGFPTPRCLENTINTPEGATLFCGWLSSGEGRFCAELLHDAKPLSKRSH